MPSPADSASGNSAVQTERGCSFLFNTPAASFTPEMFVADEALMIRTAEDFSRKEVLPVSERLEAQEEGLMPSLVRKAGSLGFCGPDISEKFGGLGLSKNLAARMLEFLSLDASFSVTIGITSGISQVGLSLFGTDGQRSQYLPRLASGEWIGAYALSEPNSGSDALSLGCRAERGQKGWVLDGTKMWISNAKWADLFVIIAKIDGEQVSAFLVERSTPGLTVAREEHKMGLKGSSTARLVLDHAEVPFENLLHEPGKGHQVAFNALNLGRFKLSSMSLGPAREALGQAARYSQDRKQFGHSISHFGLIRQKLAEMAARFWAAESMIYRTGALIDGAFAAEDGTRDGNRRAAEEFAVECSACKVMSTETEAFVVDESLQVFGGYGFTEEFPMARLYRDARVSRIYEGTNEINRVSLATRLMRNILNGKVSKAPAKDSFISEIVAAAFAKFDVAPATVLSGSDQIVLGALSDLAMLAYAEQSARLRAGAYGGIHRELYKAFLSWANFQAAFAFGRATGEGISIPASPSIDFDALAESVLAKNGPI